MKKMIQTFFPRKKLTEGGTFSFLMALAPIIGPKFFVSKVWLVGCLNFSHEVTKTYQVKKVEKNLPDPGKVPKTANFDTFLQICQKYAHFGLFLLPGPLIHSFFT